MTLFLKALPYIAAALVLAMLVVLANRWDNSRLQRSYDAGVAAERGRWELARSEAINRAAIASQEATRASEAATDTGRGQTAVLSAASASQTQSIVEEIVHATATTPLPACDPGGRPVQLPAGVLRSLDKARRSALRDP